MKLYLLATVTVFALSGPALAQGAGEDNLNGSTLGKSMPGSYSGVPYHSGSTAAPAGGGARPYVAPHRMHRKHYRRHKHSGM